MGDITEELRERLFPLLPVLLALFVVIALAAFGARWMLRSTLRDVSVKACADDACAESVRTNFPGCYARATSQQSLFRSFGAAMDLVVLLTGGYANGDGGELFAFDQRELALCLNDAVGKKVFRVPAGRPGTAP